MKAETALNVIEALPEKELNRLMVMLGVRKAESKPKKRKLLTKTEATEWLLTTKFKK